MEANVLFNILIFCQTNVRFETFNFDKENYFLTKDLIMMTLKCIVDLWDVENTKQRLHVNVLRNSDSKYI